MRRCLAETASVRNVNTETKVTFDKVEVVLGEAEWPAMQTVHLADSVAFRW